MRRRSAAFAAAAGLLVVSGCSAADAEAPDKQAYVSLGDSLAVGYQPGEGNGGETPYGYPGYLYRSLYGEDSTLEHVSLGCPGENTSSMLGEDETHCQYDEGSQLEAAEAYLEDNSGDIRLITLGIGANNFTGCVAEEGDGEDFSIDEECVDDGMERLGPEIEEIAERLRSAAGDDVQIIGMNYYNPFVVAMLLDEEEEDGEAEDSADSADSEDGAGDGEDAEEDGGEEERSGRELAEYGNEILEELNSELERVYSANGIDLADVATEFDWDNFEVPADSETDMPANVQMICDNTWMCDPELGPDIHTNDAGGRLIAEVFEREVAS